MRVCVCERERERESQCRFKKSLFIFMRVLSAVSVCVRLMVLLYALNLF